MMPDGKEFYDMISADDYVPDENFYRVVFAQSLSDLRHERGFSRKQVAEGAGVPVSFIAECERANRTPKLKQLYALTKFFNVSIDDLVGHTLENSRDVIKYRFERALEVVESSDNEIEFLDDGSCNLIIFADKDERDLDDDANEVVGFATHDAFAMFVETAVDKAIAEKKSFDVSVREIMNWWNSRDEKNSDNN